MASFFGANYANTILADLFDGAYIGLSTTTPTASGGNITEPSAANGYKRLAAAGGEFTASQGTITNTEYLYWPEATASWGSISHIIICDSATLTDVGNHVRYVGELTNAITVAQYTVPLFRPNALAVTITDVSPSA